MKRATVNFQDIGYQTTSQVDFHRFIEIFPCGRTAENPVNDFFEKTLLYWRGRKF